MLNCQKNYRGNTVTYKSYAIVSSIVGVLFGVASFVAFLFLFPENAAVLALLTGLLTIVISFPVLIITQKIDDLKYRKIENDIKGDIIHVIHANVMTGSKTIYAKIYFTDMGLVLAAFEKKKLLVDKINFGDMAKVVTDGAVSLEIHMKNSSVFRILSAGIADVMPLLKKHSAYIQNDL